MRFVLLLITASLALGEEGLAQQGRRPNVVIILSDDMGYSDIGCYGGEIQTPTLDGLAQGGLRFTHFYNTGRCCPTRASLLTGLYPHQTGIGWMMQDQGLDGYRGELNRNCVTIAEALQQAGYATYMSGKWHVTGKTNPTEPSEQFNWPFNRGFQKSYGIINGASSLWDPNSLFRDDRLTTCLSDEAYQPSEPYHLTDAISDNAANFVRQHDSQDPFFLYVAYTAAHWPMHARPSDIERYRGRYDSGYDAIRQTRLKKMEQLGVIEPGTALSETAGDWNDVADPRWEAACMEVYAAMVDQMDRGIGRIVAALEDKGQLQNTLIMFLQDNGGCAEPAGRDANPQRIDPRGDLPTLPPIPADKIHYFGSVPKQTRDGWPIRRGHVMPGPADTYIGYGKNWANVSNTPFREYKHWVHEGGIATPLVVHWPNGFSAQNELRREPSHLVDLMATCIDVAQTAYPIEFRGNPILPLQGESLLPVMKGDSLQARAIFWEHEGHRAVRLGRWKLVAKGKMRDRELPVQWELYDMQSDRTELNDLADVEPERVAAMATLWEHYAKQTAVFPCPKPN